MGRFRLEGCFCVWRVGALRRGCLVEGEKISEAWVRIVRLLVFLWDPIILRRVGKKCGGFLAVDSQTKKLEELQWARILVKTNGEDLPNALEIWINEVCYSLFLWWEIRPSLRKILSDTRRKTNSSRDEVGGDNNAHASQRVVEEKGDVRLEVLQQPVEGTWGQESGSWHKVDPSQNGSVAWSPEGLKLLSRPSKSSPIVDPRNLKLAGGLSKSGPVANLKSKGVTVAADGLVSLKDFWWAGEEENNTATGIEDLDGDSSPGPSQLPLVDSAQNDLAHSPAWSGPSNWSNPESKFIKLWVMEGLRKQIAEEQQTVESSKTDHILIEKAMRYENVFASWGKRISGSVPSLSFPFGQTPLEEYYDYSGAVSEAV